MIVIKPHIGVLVWSWLSYMNPHRLTWGATYDFQFAQIVALVTMGAWLVSREPKRVPLTPITVLLFLFAAWMCVTTAFALAPDPAFEKWKLVMKILLITIITLPLMQTRERLNALIWVIVLSVSFYGLKGGIFVILTGGHYTVWGPPESFLEANNSLGLALTMILPLMRYLQMQSQSLLIRSAWTVGMALCALSVLSTYSRGAVLAISAMLFFLWLKSSKKLIIGAVGMVAIVGALSFMPEAWYDRVKSIQDYESDNSAMSRIKMWRYGFNVATERPFVGGGFGVFPETSLYPRFGLSVCASGQEITADCVLAGVNSHSIYFETLGEHGFVGLVLFLMIGFVAFRTGTWVILRVRDRPDLKWSRDLAGMSQVALVGFAIGGLFVNRAYFDLYYHLLAIIVLNGVIVAKTLETAAPSEERQVPAERPLGAGPLPSRPPATPSRHL